MRLLSLAFVALTLALATTANAQTNTICRLDNGNVSGIAKTQLTWAQMRQLNQWLAANGLQCATVNRSHVTDPRVGGVASRNIKHGTTTKIVTPGSTRQDAGSFWRTIKPKIDVGLKAGLTPAQIYKPSNNSYKLWRSGTGGNGGTFLSTGNGKLQTFTRAQLEAKDAKLGCVSDCWEFDYDRERERYTLQDVTTAPTTQTAATRTITRFVQVCPSATDITYTLPDGTAVTYEEERRACTIKRVTSNHQGEYGAVVGGGVTFGPVQNNGNGPRRFTDPNQVRNSPF